ncbi:MAG: F0F1 ATP synthase subunit B [Acidobacteria bacterium]|nr:F0F1 ATP synthase subunit B [Acidobacteriota bacterium]
MRRSTVLRVASLALLWTLFAGVTAAFGAEVGESTTFLGLPRWVFSWFNMLVFFGGLGYLVGPMAMSALENRRDQIRDSLMTARRQRADAEELHAGLDDQLAALEAEVAQAAERARQEGERDAREIAALADRERERMLEQARAEIRNRAARARVELAQHAARLATSLAAERLEREVDSAARRRILDRGLLSLESRADDASAGADAR